MFSIRRYLNLFCVAILTSTSLYSMNMAPQMATNSAISVQNNLWHITLPNGEVHVFNPTQINKIINDMPADLRARLTHDASVFPSYIQRNNITFHSQETIECAASSSSTPPQHIKDYRATMDRMKALAQQTSQRRMHIVVDSELANYSKLQREGNKKELEKLKKDLDAELQKAWFGGSKIANRLRHVEYLLAQNITSVLEVVRVGSLEEAEAAVKKMSERWPHYQHIVTTRQELQQIEAYHAHIGFNELEVAKGILESRTDYQIKQSEIAQHKELQRQQEQAKKLVEEQARQSREMVSTSASSAPNISKEVDARVEAAINKLNTIDPKNDTDAFIRASTDILADLKVKGLLEPAKNRNQEVLAIFAKAALRRLNPVTQFKDVAKLAYHIAKWTLLESGNSAYVTAESLKNAQSSLDRLFETIKAMDPRSLTEDQWAEFLGTVVGDFAFFGGAGKVVYHINLSKVSRGSNLVGELYKFGPTATMRMEDVNRSIPIQILDDIIKFPMHITKDPKNLSNASMYYSQLWKDGKLYNVEVLYDKATNEIGHFLYRQDSLGPLSKIKN